MQPRRSTRWSWPLRTTGAMAPSAERAGPRRGRSARGRPPCRVPMPVHSGQAPNGRVEGERARLELLEGQRVVVGAGQLLGEPALALAGRPRRGRRSRATTTPPARPSAVSTESVSRRLRRSSLTTRRSTTTSMVCFSCFFSLGGSVSGSTSPSTRARAKPLVWSSANRSTYSPLRARTTGASTWKRVPSGSSSTRSTICCGVCRVIGSAADRAVRLADAREQQPEVVVDLGDRADRRARVAVGRLLVDRDGRRQALDEVDVGLVHLPEELPGVGRQRLDVAALALGEDRVEGERGLARPGEPGEDDEGVAGQVERDVLEVVLASATDDETVGHGSLQLGSGRAGEDRPR